MHLPINAPFGDLCEGSAAHRRVLRSARPGLIKELLVGPHLLALLAKGVLNARQVKQLRVRLDLVLDYDGLGFVWLVGLDKSFQFAKVLLIWWPKRWMHVYSEA